MVSTLNTSRSNANPPRMQDPPGDADSRPPGIVEAMQANTNEVEALRLVNQRRIEELEQLTKQMQHPRETQQTQEGHNIPPPPREEQHDHDIPRGAETEAESSRARGRGPQLAPAEEGNGAMLGGHVENEELHHLQSGAEEQSWEQRFRSLQQELSRVKEVVKGPQTLWTPWYNKLNHPSQPRYYVTPFGKNSERHKWKHLMESKTPSTISIPTKIKWSCMGIRTLCDAGLSLPH